MTSKDDKVRDLLEAHGEEFNQETIWRVQGTPVIYHSALERMASRALIKFGEPKVIRAERDECVMLINAWRLGESGEVVDEVWTFGEALIGVNYRVTGKQAAYTYCVSEKRGKDRAILKLLGITDEALDETSAWEREAEAKRVFDEPLPRSTDAAYRRRTPSQQLKIDLCEALWKIRGSKVELWLKKPQVQEALESLEVVDRIDIDRMIAERMELA